MRWSRMRARTLAKKTPTAPESRPRTRNSIEKTWAMRLRVAPSVLRTTTSRIRRKRVLATLEARMMAPERMEKPARKRMTRMMCPATSWMVWRMSARLMTVMVG